jgi:hypothetical protein
MEKWRMHDRAEFNEQSGDSGQEQMAEAERRRAREGRDSQAIKDEDGSDSRSGKKGRGERK